MVFGGGNPSSSNPAFGGAIVAKASSGGLSLANGGGVITLLSPSDEVVTFVSYGGSTLPGDRNQSLTRAPDVTGELVLHQLAEGSAQRAFSPGTRLDGTPFAPTPVPSPSPTPTPSPSPSPSPSPTASPSPSPLPSPTATPPPTPSPTPSPSPSPSPTPSPTPSVSPSPTPTPVLQSAILISQVYGGGGNSGALFRNDFIELFNRGNVAVDLTGWSVQYAGATSGSWSVTPLGSSSLAPGHYLLIQEGSGGSAGALLPAPDVTGSINLAATAGKVALVSSVTPITGSCPAPGAIVDLVGYGATANCFEGTAPAAAPSNTLAVQRSGNGCTDSQNNSEDFLTAAPAPRNTAHAPVVCSSVSSYREPNMLREWIVWIFLKRLEVRI